MKLTPVVPFEPIRTERVPQGSDWIAQIKWDGVRMLAYYDGEECRLINRSLNERTQHYPEFGEPQIYCPASSFILDGELIAFDADKPSFHEIMKRDSLRKPDRIALAVKQVPVTYMIFDVLFYNGEWVTQQPLHERQQLLNRIVHPTANVQVVQNFTDTEGLFDIMRAHKMEGIVYKNLTSSYLMAGKDARWQKRKFSHDLYAVVGGVTLRAGTVNSLLLGAIYKGSLVYIGHAGSGHLTVQDWHTLTETIKPLIVSHHPFANEPSRQKDAIWLKPQLVAKIQFMEWTVGRTMRHPTIQSIVKQGDPAACQLEEWP